MPRFTQLLCLLSLAIAASAGLIQRNDLTARSDLQRREGDVNDYNQVFPGTGPTDRDASVNGAGYLTFQVVPDDGSTYNIPACLHACDTNPKCIFANLYYEYNVQLFDSTGQPSHQKCGLYSQVHSAADKTNFGGQIIEPKLGRTVIQDSSGWALQTPLTPDTPSGFELVFGPVTAQTSSPQALNSADLPTYDVQACAKLCTNQAPDPTFGACKFFNIYRISGQTMQTAFQCNVFALSTGTEHLVSPSGEVIRDSRGYHRIGF
ncbi:hypothetical protein BDN72DRAFT_840320 [Pluteus cervinus]|uniref:Uncharacterized protein n=1 Tax=Pluteus cervinus TaxID=181527 RepID=A0ACD3AUT4_9AGAR|nr:hypothetical protein BDN72DRAFT_840320 [Pluteus cervinus]